MQGFISMGLFEFGEKEGPTRWGSMCAIAAFVLGVVWFVAQAATNSVGGGLNQLWWARPTKNKHSKAAVEEEGAVEMSNLSSTNNREGQAD